MRKILLVFLAIFIFAGSGAAQDIELRVFDVGQGDSMLLRLPGGENILVDGGPRPAGSVVVENLRALSIKKIDLLVATHPHEDHIGGLVDVLNNFQVEQIWDSGCNHGSAVQKKFLETALRKKIPLAVPKSEFSQNFGEVRISVLAPTRLIKSGSEANNNCLIIFAAWKNISFLLMGDAEITEQKTVSKFPRAKILKLAHHGSRNGTNKFLLNNVQPEIAVATFSTGNSYGHPHKEVIKLLDDAKIPMYSTNNGNIVITSNGDSLSVEYEKVGALWKIWNFIKNLFGW